MTHFTKLTAAAALLSATAFTGIAQAGSLQDPAVEAPVAVPAP